MSALPDIVRDVIAEAYGEALVDAVTGLPALLRLPDSCLFELDGEVFQLPENKPLVPWIEWLALQGLTVEWNWVDGPHRIVRAGLDRGGAR